MIDRLICDVFDLVNDLMIRLVLLQDRQIAHQIARSAIISSITSSPLHQITRFADGLYRPAIFLPISTALKPGSRQFITNPLTVGGAAST